VPFDLHVVERATFDAEDRAWVDLARRGFVDLPAAFQLRGRPLALPGVSLVQLGVIADPDGRSGTSYFPTALVTRARSGEWRFVHVHAELPPGRPDTPAAPATDTRLSIRECAADAEPAILAKRIVDRGPILAERCESLDARVAAAILAQRDPDFAVRVFLEAITEAMIGGRSFRIVAKRSDLDRDVRWLPSAAFGPWNVARSADAPQRCRLWIRFPASVRSAAPYF